jgi:hypothetical protein
MKYADYVGKRYTEITFNILYVIVYRFYARGRKVAVSIPFEATGFFYWSKF